MRHSRQASLKSRRLHSKNFKCWWNNAIDEKLIVPDNQVSCVGSYHNLLYSEITEKGLKSTKKFENGWKKVVRPAFGCGQHPKPGRNTQQVIKLWKTTHLETGLKEYCCLVKQNFPMHVYRLYCMIKIGQPNSGKNCKIPEILYSFTWAFEVTLTQNHQIIPF